MSPPPPLVYQKSSVRTTGAYIDSIADQSKKGIKREVCVVGERERKSKKKREGRNKCKNVDVARSRTLVVSPPYFQPLAGEFILFTAPLPPLLPRRSVRSSLFPLVPASPFHSPAHLLSRPFCLFPHL